MQGSPGAAYEAPMLFWLTLALAVAVLAVDSAVAEERNCLNKEQQRAAIASGKAVRLGVALKAGKRRGGGGRSGERGEGKRGELGGGRIIKKKKKKDDAGALNTL